MTLVISTSLISITAYLEVKILSLLKHENLTTSLKILWKRGGAISPLSHNIFNIPLTSRLQFHIYLLNVVVQIMFSSILQIWCVEVRISRSISESPLEFEITRVNCISTTPFNYLSMCLKTAGWAASNPDLDQKLLSVASDMGLHCLLRPICPNTIGKHSMHVHFMCIWKDWTNRRWTKAQMPACNLTTVHLLNYRVMNTAKDWTLSSTDKYW